MIHVAHVGGNKIYIQIFGLKTERRRSLMKHKHMLKKNVKMELIE